MAKLGFFLRFAAVSHTYFHADLIIVSVGGRSLVPQITCL